jgi:hypothetical protein
MTFRKLAAYVPLAVLVGAILHVAATGFEHAPGRSSAPLLALAIGGALSLALVAAFCCGALSRGIGGLPQSIATKGDLAYGTVALAMAGTGSYALIELLEGHVGATGAMRALLASLPVAAFVLELWRRATHAAEAAGTRLLAASPVLAHGPLHVPTRRRRTTACRRLGDGSRRGRSPPLFV